MVFSYNWLQSFFAKKLPPPKKLAELLTMHSFEVEAVVKRGKDWVLEINVLPDRAGDCFCHLGVAREIGAITKSNLKNLPASATPKPLQAGQKSKMPTVHTQQIKNQKLKSNDFVKLEVASKDDCPRYSAKVIAGVKIGASPKWMQERLQVCGLQPINNVVDATNYVMLELGQPLHAFDLDKVKSVKIRNPKSEIRNKSQIQNSKFQTKRIIVRRAKEGEKIKALDGKIYSLDKDILVIADEQEPIAVAGIKGGEGTTIDGKTKDIIIEAANFNQRVARLGSQKLKLKTDASLRFEHGLDPNIIPFAQERVCALIQAMAHGKVVQGMADFYPEKVRAKIIRLDLDYVNNLLGVKISEKEIRTILEGLGFKFKVQSSKFKVAVKGSKLLEVIVPTYRLDINLPEDLIEEIGRLYGYEKILAVFPKAGLLTAERSSELLWQELLGNILKELGFIEVYNYSFVSQKDKEALGLREELVEIENPLSSDFKYLRPTVLINLLKNVKQNARYLDLFSLFELGKIFKRCPVSDVRCQASEKTMLSGLIFNKISKVDSFYELKGVCDALLEELGIAGVWYDEYQPTPEDSANTWWQEGRCAEIKVGQEELGFLGEISTEILTALGISSRVYGFDFDLKKLLKYASEEQEYQPILCYPVAARDVAILVPLETKVEEVLNVIEVAGGKLVRDVDLFDIYEGEELPEGKKNFAFHIVLQAEDRTLRKDELDILMQKIISALEENVEWEVRK